MTKIPAKDIAKICKLEITSGKGKLSAAYADELGRMANILVGYKSKEPGGLAHTLNQEMREEVNLGLDFVNALIKAGIPGASSNPDPITGIPVNWRPLTAQWIARKRPKSKDLYWKNTGRLSLGFGNIVNNYKRAIDKQGPTVVLRTRSAKYGKASFKYDIRLSLPRHRSEVFTRVFAEAFIDGAYLNETMSTTDYAESIVSYLEGPGRTSRPFIAKVMAGTGARFKSSLGRRVNDFLPKNRRLLLSLRS